MKDNHTPQPLAVGIQQAGALLGVSARSVQNYIQAKMLPARKIGRRTVLLVKDLEAFLKRDQPSPASKPSGNGDGR